MILFFVADVNIFGALLYAPSGENVGDKRKGDDFSTYGESDIVYHTDECCRLDVIAGINFVPNRSVGGEGFTIVVEKCVIVCCVHICKVPFLWEQC